MFTQVDFIKSIDVYIGRCQGRIKRRGHATAIYQIANGRGRASKNRQEIIARALYTVRHLAS